MKKFKKMASGGDTLSVGDKRALERAGMSTDTSNRAAELEAYRKRQDAKERAARKPRDGGKAAALRAMNISPNSPEARDIDVYGAAALDRGKGGGRGRFRPPYGGPASDGGRARALREMGIDPNSPEAMDIDRTSSLSPRGMGIRDAGNDLDLGRSYPLKKGGKVKKMATGGRARSYKDMDAGSGGGMGRIEKTAIAKAGKKVAMKYKKGGTIRMAGGTPKTDADYTANPLNDSGYRELTEKSKAPGRRRAKQEAELSFLDKKLNEAYDRRDSGERGRLPREVLDMLTAFPKNASGDDTYYSGKARRDALVGQDLADATLRAQGRAVRGYKKGGKAKVWEGSKADEAQDKKLAKKYGMSMKEWEASSMDAKHDAQKSAKGLKKGGKAHAKSCDCMACGGKAKYAKGGMSTAQDGKKAPLRPRPSAMAKGGKVTFGDKPLPGTKTKANPGMVLTGAATKKTGLKAPLRGKASGAKPTGMMKPLGMTKMASGGKVRGTGIAQRGTKFIGEV